VIQLSLMFLVRNVLLSLALISFLGTITTHLMFNLITASINSESLKSYKALNELFLHVKYSLNIRRKIKVTQKHLNKKLKKYNTFLQIRF
jgi:hypothetical protein